MPISEPEGEITAAEDYLAETIAASPAFQELVGEGSAAAAKNHIYFDALPPPAADGKHTLEELQAIRPYALIYTDEETGIRFRRTSAVGGYEVGGVLKWDLVRDVPEAEDEDPSEVDRTMKNLVGNVIADMLVVADTAGYLAIEELTMHGPMRSSNDDLPAIGDVQMAFFEVAWGTI